MSEPIIWTDERIKRQAITNCCYINNVVKGLTEMRDEYEAARIELETENDRLTRLLANVTADNLLIARLLSDAGIEHSGYSNQAQRVEMLIAKQRKSQDYSIAFARDRNDARRRITELEEQLAAALATIERATWCDVCGLPAEHCRENH